MKKYYLIALFFWNILSAQAESPVIASESPAHRVALLELYTSQGCSSCPPADRWLSKLKHSGISSEQIIPLAFHVTYWDYIGWQDRFASSQYDKRQRQTAFLNSSRRVYTPQFVLAGNDFRALNDFNDHVLDIVSQPSSVQLKVTAQRSSDDEINIELKTKITDEELNSAALYLAVYENDLQSDVDAGENDGELLRHDFVVRKLYGPFMQTEKDTEATIKKSLPIEDIWKRTDLNIVAFAQNPKSGEILQAVRLDLKDLHF